MKGLLDVVSRHAKGRGAFYTMSPRRVDSALNRWRAELPFVTPYYAVKCNPEPQFLNMLYDRDVRFDCASHKELQQVQSLHRGDVASRIVYANPCKSARDLETARDIGSPMTVVDSVEEVEKLAGYEGGTLIRIAVDDSKSAMPFSSKFGCSWTAIPKIGLAARALGVPIHGISFHIGSGGGSQHETAIDSAYCCIENLREKSAGAHNPSIIDIGGGFVSESFSSAAASVRRAATRLDRVTTRAPLRWIAEPGRYFAANSFDLFVQVIGKKPGKKVAWHYTIDDSLYGQFSSILFDHAKPKWARVGEGTRRSTTGALFGRTCDSLDVIARATMEELEVGDWLYFPRMGAYTRATASEFNGFPMPAVVQADICEPPLQFPTDAQYIEPVSSNALWAH